MAINARKQLNPTVIALKQASIGRMLTSASTLHAQGQLKKAPQPTGVTPPAVRSLRVKST
jgi:hypothetical protein